MQKRPSSLLRILFIVAVVAMLGLLGLGGSYQASAHPWAFPSATQTTTPSVTPTTPTTPITPTVPTTPTTSSATSVSPNIILAQAAVATSTMSSGTGDVNITVNVTADPSAMPSATQAFFNQPITLSGTYAFNGDPLAIDSAMTLVIAGQNVPLGIRVVGDQAWVQALGQWYDLSTGMLGGGTGMSFSQADITSLMQALANSGFDASTWLTGLTVVGQENVNGSNAYHLSGTVDVNKALSDIFSAMQDPNVQGMMGSGMMGSGITSADLAGAQATVNAWLQDLTVDMWVATDTYQFRQFQVSANVMPPAGQGQGISAVTAQATVTLDTATSPVTITPPTNVRPFSDLQQSLSTLLNLFSGSTSGSTGGTGSTGTTLGQ